MKERYILGGFYLIRPAQRALCMNNELLPEKIITVSECICDNLPGTWDLERADSIKNILHDPKKELSVWVEDQFEKGYIGWQYGFGNIETARAFYARFLNDMDDVYLFGIGVSEEDAVFLLGEEKPAENTGGTLVYSVLSRAEILDTANLVGFDVLGYDMGYFHSYICNGFESPFYTLFDMKPNKFGLYDSYAKAKQAAEHLSGESSGAEPAVWLSWAVCRFEL